MEIKKVFWCQNCLNMSTRPRITFDSRGWCNACQWSEEKEKLEWSKREAELQKLLNENRSKSGNFDCVVTVSGGKDGSYVAHQLKHKYGMNPLAITVRPALSLPLGEENLHNFINSGYNHIHISTNPIVLDKLNKYGFIQKGFPYYGWLIAIMTACIRTAINFDIPLMFYGEDGEVEYGGSDKTKNVPLYDINYMKSIYLEGGHEEVLNKLLDNEDIEESDLAFFRFPSESELNQSDLKFTHWSYYEPWDSYRNYIVAKEHCGLKENDTTNDGTFTNFAQNDQALYSLHAYLMYLKFGFGRATQDAGIEIRRGAMKRDQAIELVRIYDNHFPEEFLETYLKYYDMSADEFFDVLEEHSNKSLFNRQGNQFVAQFEVGEEFIL